MIMYVKMQLIRFPRTCAMPFLFQVKQHLERERERQRETEGEDYFLQTSNSAATSETRSQMFPVEDSFYAGLQICSCDQSY